LYRYGLYHFEPYLPTRCITNVITITVITVIKDIIPLLLQTLAVCSVQYANQNAVG